MVKAACCSAADIASVSSHNHNARKQKAKSKSAFRSQPSFFSCLILLGASSIKDYSPDFGFPRETFPVFALLHPTHQHEPRTRASKTRTFHAKARALPLVDSVCFLFFHKKRYRRTLHLAHLNQLQNLTLRSNLPYNASRSFPHSHDHRSFERVAARERI